MKIILNFIIIILFINLNGDNNMMDEDNLLKNCDFENALGPEWNPSLVTGVNVYVDNKESYSGKNSIKIENFISENKAFYGCNQIISAPPCGNWLALKSAIKIENLKGHVGLGIHYFDSNDAKLPIRDADISLHLDNESRDWVIYSLDFFIHKGTKKILVALYLQGQGTVWFDNLSLNLIKLNVEGYKNPSKGAYLLRKENPVIWFEYAEQKVYRETSVPRGTTKSIIEITGARNEWEPFQLVFTPKKEFKNCFLEFTDLVNEDGNKIKKEYLKYWTVGFVNIKNTSTPHGVKGANPDILMPVDRFDLLAKSNNPIWINIKIPKSAHQGIYQGQILFKIGEKTHAKIPLQITVWNFALPQKNHLYVRSNFWLSLVRKYDRRDSKEILADYYENLQEHRINAFSKINLETKIIGDSLVCFFDKFDRKVKNLFDNYRFEAVTVGPFIGDASGWKFRRKWMGIDPESPRFKYFLKQYCKRLESHLKANGWLNRIWLQYWDEPRLRDPDFEKIVNIGKIIKRTAPKLKIFMTTRPIQCLFGIVDIWCVTFYDRYFNATEIKDRKNLSEKIFIYHNDPYIDTPLIDKRLYAWRYKLAGIDGIYAWWNLTFWQNNPYKNPHMVEEGKSGRKISLKPGDGVLLYPNQDGAGPPVNSLRWEIFRQGLEDYEYFWLLEQSIKSALVHLEANELFSDFTEYRINEIIGIMVADYFRTWKRNVNYLYEIRQRMAEEIQEINQSPIVLIITAPQEGRIINNKKVKIFGLAEGDTKIIINGESVSVKNGGSFFIETDVLSEGYVLIEARLDNKEKIIKRFFE